MPASPGIQSVMTTCAFLPNGGMTTEPGPAEVAIGVAGAVDAGPPGLNAGGAGELHAARSEQTRTVQIKAARAVVADARAARAVMAADARAARAVMAADARAARAVVAADARAARAVMAAGARAARGVAAAGNGWRFMRLRSARMGGARR